MCKLQSSLGVHPKNTGQKRVCLFLRVFPRFLCQLCIRLLTFSNIKVTSACRWAVLGGHLWSRASSQFTFIPLSQMGAFDCWLVSSLAELKYSYSVGKKKKIESNLGLSFLPKEFEVRYSTHWRTDQDARLRSLRSIFNCLRDSNRCIPSISNSSCRTGIEGKKQNKTKQRHPSCP